MYNNSSEILYDGWLIAHDENNVGKSEKWYEAGVPAHLAKQGVVPSFGHQYFPYSYGVFWFQKRFIPKRICRADEIYELRIGAADFLCETYINGKYIGTYRDTETPFAYDVTAYIKPKEENLLTFRISRPHTEEVDGYRFGEIPHRNQRMHDIWPGMCFNCTGILGNVELAVLPRLRITDMYINGNVDTKNIEAVYTVHSDNITDADLVTRIFNKRTGELCTEARTPVRLTDTDATAQINIPLDDIRLWSPDDPFLYTVQAELYKDNTLVHTIQKSCGFRTFRVNDDGFFELNGKRLFLRCSHSGNAFCESTYAIPTSPDLVRKDLLMAKASGLNMVRFISGIALPEQLDYADELGLMIYEEPVASWLTENGQHSKEIFDFAVREMVKRDRSHPSVCIWGMLNETLPTPPFDECCRHGREALKTVRRLDETRLVLYSSGRFDGDAFIGSVSNPFHDDWQCLWNKESPDNPTHVDYQPGDPGAFFRNVGDIHCYPRYPISEADTTLLRTVGCDVKRPVFLSENGCGSLFDVIWLTKTFEQNGVDKSLPDVRQIYRMQQYFLDDLKRCGFEEEYAFPGDILRESQRLSARHRAKLFDIIRSNPYMNGYSITGLLDHSICGEGLWTLLREWKPGVVDAMANGLAPLKWCILPDKTHVYSGKPFHLDVVLANEDVLRGKEYPVSLRILGEDGIVFSHSALLRPSADDLKGFAVPVFDLDITLSVPTGTYEIHCDIDGAAATDSVMKIYSTDAADIHATVAQIVAWGLNENTLALLARQGVKVISLAEADTSVPALVVLGNGAEAEKEDVFAEVYKMLESGSRVFVASRFALKGSEGWAHYLRVDNKPDNYPNYDGYVDWLYHKEYLAKRRHPYFKDMPKGIMDWEYWGYMINGADFRNGTFPTEIASASFGPGNINENGYEGGFNIGTYKMGKGAMTVNTYNLVENIGINPAADRLFINILNEEAARL